MEIILTWLTLWLTATSKMPICFRRKNEFATVFFCSLNYLYLPSCCTVNSLVRNIETHILKNPGIIFNLSIVPHSHFHFSLSISLGGGVGSEERSTIKDCLGVSRGWVPQKLYKWAESVDSVLLFQGNYFYTISIIITSKPSEF